MEPFQVYHTLWGHSVPPVRFSQQFFLNPTHRVNVIARLIELTKVPVFEPTHRHATSFSQLHKLDMLPGERVSRERLL